VVGRHTDIFGAGRENSPARWAAPAPPRSNFGHHHRTQNEAAPDAHDGGRTCRLFPFPPCHRDGSRERLQSAEHPYVAREMSGSSSGNDVGMAGTTAMTPTTPTTTTTREEKDSPRAAAEGAANGGELQDESAPPSERERDNDESNNDPNSNNSSDGDGDDMSAASSTVPDFQLGDSPRPSVGRRARLVRDLMTSVGALVVDRNRSSEPPIQHWYDEASEVYEKFFHAHLCHRLDDAFSHGILYCWHALQLIPKHASYESLESLRMKYESVGRVEFITDALDGVRDRMDEEEVQREHLRALLRRLEEEPPAAAAEEGEGGDGGGGGSSNGAAGSGGKDSDAHGGGQHRRRSSGGRRAARIRARLKVDDFYVSPFGPIEQHYRRADELHMSFVKARRDDENENDDDNNNDRALDDAYGFGIRYWLCATKVIPMHPEYESTEYADLKRECLERADAVFVAVGEIEDKMTMMMMDRDVDKLEEKEEDLEEEELEIGEGAEANSIGRHGNGGPGELDEEDRERDRESQILQMALEKERAERDEVARKYEELMQAYEALKASTAASAAQADRENVGHRHSSSNNNNNSSNPLVTDPSARRCPTTDFSTRVSRRRGVLAEMGTAPNEPRANDNNSDDNDGTRKEPRTPRLYVGIGSAEENHRSRADIDIRGGDHRWDRLKSPITVDWRDASAHRQQLHLAHGSAAAIPGRPSSPNEREADGREPSGDGTAGNGPSKRARPTSRPRGPPGKRSRRNPHSGRGAAGSAIADGGSDAVATRRGRSATGASAGCEREAHAAHAGDDRRVTQVSSAGTNDCHPTEKCGELMRAVDTKEADGLDVFKMATAHFGDVNGGKGSLGRTWVPCHCCAACRANPRSAFVTSYKGTRAGTLFFDFRAQEIPKEARDQLLRHLLDQRFRKIAVVFPPYCPPPPPPTRGGRRPRDALP
jgi:hypothetical protein